MKPHLEDFCHGYHVIFFSHKDLCCLQMLVCMALVPIFTFHVSVSDLHDPTIGLPILLQENRWTDHGNL
jgi:hypothetical protein